MAASVRPTVHIIKVHNENIYWLDTVTVSQKKRSHFYFLNNSVKNEPILITFGTLNPEGA